MPVKTQKTAALHVEAAAHLARKIPALKGLIGAIGPLPRLTRRRVALPEAIARITVGQMLSGRAAETIYGRMLKAAKERGLDGARQLDFDAMTGLGLSRRKARTIIAFSEDHERDPKRFSHWHGLPTEQLYQEVNQFWGLSDWSAAMLGIFYLGNEDIFPMTDGSIARALRLLRLKEESEASAEFFEARPYRSYLSLYLWKGLDEGHLT